MPKITEKIQELLGKRKFVSVGTATRDGRPNSAPKLFLHAKRDSLYLIDHVMGQTVVNIKENPLVSVSFMEQDALEAYRLNGTAKVIERGKSYDAMLREWDEKVVKLSADRVIEAVRTGKKHEHFEVEISEKFAILKIKINDVVKIGRRGDIWKESD